MLLYVSTYILETSRKRNVIKENIYDGVRFERWSATLLKRNFYCKFFEINISNLTTNETLHCKASQTSFSET